VATILAWTSKLRVADSSNVPTIIMVTAAVAKVGKDSIHFIALH